MMLKRHFQKVWSLNTNHVTACSFWSFFRVSTWLFLWGTQWYSWLRRHTTGWNVTVSVLTAAIGTFHWLHCTAPGSSHAPTERSTRNISCGGKGNQCIGLIILTIFLCWLSGNLGVATPWNPQGLSRPVLGLLYLTWFDYSISFTFLYHMIVFISNSSVVY